MPIRACFWHGPESTTRACGFPKLEETLEYAKLCGSPMQKARFALKAPEGWLSKLEILYSTVLYSAILYHTILYYIVL